MNALNHTTALKESSDRMIAWQNTSLAKLHELIGDATVDARTPMDPMGGIENRRKVGAPSPLVGLQVEDQVRPITPHLYPPMTDELRAQTDTFDSLMDKAWSDYQIHKQPKKYRADCLRARDAFGEVQ